MMRLASVDRVKAVLLSIDLLIGFSSWYLLLYLVNAVYECSRTILVVSLLFALRLASSSILLLSSGVIADKLGVVKTISYSMCFLPPLTLTLYLLYDSNGEALLSIGTLVMCFLFLIAVVVEALVTTYNSLKYALVARIPGISVEELNAIFELVYSILLILGPLASIALMHLALIGVVVVIACQAASITLMFLVKSCVKEPGVLGDASVSKLSLVHLVLCLSKFLRVSHVLTACTCMVFISFAGGIVNVALVLLASRVSNVLLFEFIDVYSLVLTCIGLGSAIASFMVIWSKLPKNDVDRLFPVGMLLMATYPLVIALTLAYRQSPLVLPLFILASVLNGWGNSIVFIKLMSLIQEYAPKDSTAKAVTFTNLMSSLASIASTILAGVALEAPATTYILLFTASVILAIPLILKTIHHRRGLPALIRGLSSQQ